MTTITNTSRIIQPFKTLLQILVVNFGLFFQTTVVFGCQLLFLVIYPNSKKTFRKIMLYLMRLWSQNLVLLIQWFAPTTFVLTFDKSCGPLSDNIQHTEKGIHLHMPERVILTSNHQVKKKKKRKLVVT